MDLLFINDLENGEYKIGLLMIDIFSTYMTVVPVKTEQPDDILQAIKDCIANIEGKPIVCFYTDEEGSSNSKIIKQYFLDNHIQHIITRGHAAVAERSITAIKDLIYRRIDQNPDSQWTDAKVLANALTNYNYRMKRRMTKMTPNDARAKKNILEVKTNLELHRIRKRTYTDIRVGDSVRIYTKKKNFQTERVPVWSDNVKKVVEITENFKQQFYHLEGREKALLRHEILKV